MFIVEFIVKVLLMSLAFGLVFGFLYVFAVLPMTYFENRFRFGVWYAMIYLVVFCSAIVVTLEYLGFFVD